MNFLSILILMIGHPYYRSVVSSILHYLESESSDRGITTRFTCGSVEIATRLGVVSLLGVFVVLVAMLIDVPVSGFKLGLLDRGACVNSGLFLNRRRFSNADPMGFNEVNEVNEVEGSGSIRFFSASISSTILFCRDSNTRLYSSSDSRMPALCNSISSSNAFLRSSKASDNRVLIWTRMVSCICGDKSSFNALFL